MHSASRKEPPVTSNSRDGERHQCRKPHPVSQDLCLNRESASELTEFLAACATLTRANQALLSSIEEVVASIRAPGTQALIGQIAEPAGRIRKRMSLMERLAAELRDASK